MSDGFLEFSEDDSSAGFRLTRVELYNWGTFHNKVWSLPLEGKNGLLTGDIGSGKSTIVDAITTLLVPAHRVSYNKAAGADFKERSLRSYVMGYYKSERSDGGFSAKPVPLRKEGSFHSVILGVFENKGYGQTVTLAQVFRQKDSSGQPDRFYVVSDDEMTITSEFSDFGKDFNLLRKRLRGREKTEMFDSFPPYGGAFQRRFGIRTPQALELFHQTVSLKTVGDLTSFVREHMLESFDAESRINNLINHFENLNKAHEAILKARKQINELTPLVTNLDKYQITEEEIQQAVLCRDSLTIFFAVLKRDFLTDRIEQEILKAKKIRLEKEGITAELSRLKADRDEIKKAITLNGGDRLESLKSEAGRLEEEKNRKIEKSSVYNELAGTLDLSELKSPEDYSENRTRLESLLLEITEKISELSNQKTDIEFEFRQLREDHKILKDEINSLEQRKSNISSHQISLREKLCRDLHLDEKELPFAGELIKVKEEARNWEGAIERVLRNLGLSLLVSESLYPRVVEWVNETNLRGRLVYYKVNEREKGHPQKPDNHSLLHKITLKKESSFFNWLYDQLLKRFDFNCCETLEEFRRTGKGITQTGQIKGSPIRHEKDDRHDINDRGRYILGWSNREKIETLKKRKESLEQSIADKGEILSRMEQEIETNNDHLKQIEQLRFYSNYEELDWRPISLRLDKLNREIEELQNKSNLLKTLQTQLSDTEKAIEQTDARLDFMKTSFAKIEEKTERFRESVDAEQQIIEASSRPLDEIKRLINPLKEEFLKERKLYYESCPKAESDMREALQSRIDAARKRQDRLTQNIVSAMQNFRNEYQAETREMDASLDAGNEYREFLDNLEKENLPRFESRFKELLNENTIREVAGFQAQLNTECQKIRERIDRINKSMSAIEYNRDRYITLELLNTNDPEIRSFRQDMKNCVEGSLSGETDDQYTEAKFLQVKEIVNRFKGREGRSDSDKRWTQKVSDVRNWFAFAASERWLEDDSEYEHYTNSGGKSGGQKEKLAYTVLAASLAYQFGLEWGEVRSRSFRFVVIDEAFGRGSDESARYGLELFAKLNLQLLIITPLQKIHIIEPFVSTVGFVHNEEGKKSLLRTLTIQEYWDEKDSRKNENT